MTHSDWRTGRIGDVSINIIDGDRSAKYPKRDEFQDEGVLFLNTTNIVSDRLDLTSANFVSEEKYSTIKKGRIRPLDIVMTTRGSVGKVALYNGQGKGLINAQMLILRADGESIDPRFLFHVVRSDEFQRKLRNFASGSAQPQIPITDLRAVTIRYPNIGIQRKIATILSAYDDLIENNTRRIKILEQMAQMLYREWFVNFRFPGHEKVTMVESETGLIPEGWSIEPIASVTEILGGGTPATGVPEYWEKGDIDWYSPSDLTAASSMFMFGSAKKITELGLKKSSARLFPVNCVMMTSRATIGVVSINRTAACTNQGFITCVPGTRISHFYIYFWMLENKDKITSIATGATFKEINKRTFRELPIVVPSTSVLSQFQHTVSPIGGLIENLLRRNKILRYTRDLLLPKLVSGEVSVEQIKTEAVAQTV